MLIEIHNDNFLKHFTIMEEESCLRFLMFPFVFPDLFNICSPFDHLQERLQ